ANGTWVVLPAPGGASSTSRGCVARLSRICGNNGDIGKTRSVMRGKDTGCATLRRRCGGVATRAM
ncbi:hypothetical protein BRO13_11240, partial [Xanthomonas oryzae pv. oryzae]